MASLMIRLTTYGLLRLLSYKSLTSLCRTLCEYNPSKRFTCSGDSKRTVTNPSRSNCCCNAGSRKRGFISPPEQGCQKPPYRRGARRTCRHATVFASLPRGQSPSVGSQARALAQLANLQTGKRHELVVQ